MDPQTELEADEKPPPPLWLLPSILVCTYVPFASLFLRGKTLVISIVVVAGGALGFVIHEVSDRRRKREQRQ